MTAACEPESDRPTAHWQTIGADFRAGSAASRASARSTDASPVLGRPRDVSEVDRSIVCTDKSASDYVALARFIGNKVP
jgi:hypothetical protein